MNYMLMPLKRYFEFSGRSRRKEYWLWVLFVIVAQFVLTMLDSALGLGGSTQSYSEYGDGGASVGFSGQGGLLTLIFSLAVFIPGLAVSVRRLHDIGKSGWWLLLILLPIVGWIWLIVLYCTEGTRGPNEYGADPKAGENAPTETFA